MRKFAQHINKLLILAFIFISFSCNKQEIDPVDIFEEEELDVATASSFELDGLGTVYANLDRINEINDEIQIKGTVFTYSELGDLIPISSGDFTLSGKSGDTFSFFDGYGLGTIPKIGVLDELEAIIDPGSYYSYSTGAELKTYNESAPLQDDIHYFSIEVENALANKEMLTIGNSTFSFEHLYLDVKDPSIFFQGDAKFSENIEIKNLGVGLSANGLLEFNPYEYSENLTAQMVRPMEDMFGNIYLTGQIPIKKYSIEIYGEAIIGFVLNDNGFIDFFEEGFENANYRMGVNGKVLVNNDLMKFLPSEPIELGKATLILQIEDGENYMHVAGEAESTEVIAQVISNNGGEELNEVLAFQESVVEGYFYIGDDLENTKFYFRTATYIELPLIGTQELSEAVLAISAQDVYAYGKMSMPGVGNVSLEGTFAYDGQFSLKGTTEVKVDLEAAELKAQLEFTVTNSGVVVEARGTACLDVVVDEECVSLSVELELDWDAGSAKICANLPEIGKQCTTIN